ncbi:HMA2 domain-containing protein [Clostridium cellulovorans]|uniref:Uncharacterized protein n=1 Tax=Clostridium cellulovorans (strain ATCC 35296 / DSM 3052 / OCM 3 / 743B) TaxID=573061 RepID=D9SLG1_CLOC7|nr:hypothetical protein [Clostridium cellulovorans]ADL53598.1 hypothetical protein Clocel_3932 [Clostridium cellulovorans 743B]
MNYILKNLIVLAASTATIKVLGRDNSRISKHNNLPDFKGIVEVRHAIDGRIRFYIPILRNNEQAKNVLANELKKIGSVRSIEANTNIGTLIINYDNRRMEPQLLIAVIIKLLCLEEEVSKKPVPVLSNEMQLVKDSINMAIYNKSKGIVDGRSILILALLSSAAYRFYTGTGNKVGPTTCLMWALSYLD